MNSDKECEKPDNKKFDILRDFWMPTYVLLDRDQQIRYTLQRLIYYLLFATVVTLLILLSVPPQHYVLTMVFEKLFLHSHFPTTNDALITFEDIHTVEDFWQYFENGVVFHIYNTSVKDNVFAPDEHYKSGNLKDGSRNVGATSGKYVGTPVNSRDTVRRRGRDARNSSLSGTLARVIRKPRAQNKGNASSESGARQPATKIVKILGENLLLGSPRLRQVRVKNNSCNVNSHFTAMFNSCYGGYEQSSKYTKPFGRGVGTAWTYQTPDVVKGAYTFGKVASYDSGGYYEDLGLDQAGALSKIEDLKSAIWITRHTRAIFLDLATYNANLNLFCVFKLIFEFPPTGGVVPSHEIYTVKLIRYFRLVDTIVMGLEIFFIIFIIYYTVEEIIEIVHYKWNYFASFWNYMDLFIILLAYFCIMFNILRIFWVRKTVGSYEDGVEAGGHTPFDSLGFWHMQFCNSYAILLFLVWMKLFKYLNLSRTMSQLGLTFKRSSKEIIGFSVMFFIVFFAFALVGYLLFGGQVERFSTIEHSTLTLLMTILGDFNYEDIERTNQILGPIFFATYIFFVFFVLLNIFLAIITDTYADIKSEIVMRSSELQMIDVLKRGPRQILRKMGREVKPDYRQLAGNEIIYNLRQILRICKFPDSHIDRMLEKYGIDKNNPITELDIRSFISQLEGQLHRDAFYKTQKRTNITKEQYISQRNKLDIIDKNMKIILARVNHILDLKEGTKKKENQEKE